MTTESEYTQVVTDKNVEITNIYQDDAGNYYFKDTFDYLPVNKMYIDEREYWRACSTLGLTTTSTVITIFDPNTKVFVQRRLPQLFPLDLNKLNKKRVQGEDEDVDDKNKENENDDTSNSTSNITNPTTTTVPQQQTHSDTTNLQVANALTQVATALSKLTTPTQTTTTKDINELIYLEQITKTFDSKFPETNDKNKFFQWSCDVDNYLKENPLLPKDRLFTNIVDSVPEPIKAAWNQYKDSKFQEIQHQYFADNGKELINTPSLYQKKQLEFNKNITTIQQFEKFAMKHLKIQASIHYFVEQLSKITVFVNEDPKDTFSRVAKYLEQISSMSKKLNAIKTDDEREIRAISEINKLELFERILCITNNTVQNNNVSPLNEKVKTKFKRCWNEGKIKTTNDVREYAAKISSQVIVPGTGNDKQINKHWQSYNRRSHWSIFAISSSSRPFKRTLSTSFNSPNQPKPKRQKTTEKCKDGYNCTYFTKFGRCKFYHSAKELQSLRIKHKQSVNKRKTRNNPIKSFVTGKQLTRSPPNPTKPKYLCNKGNNCEFWQQDKCRFKHDNKTMTCSYCKKPGHPSIRCRTRINNTNNNNSKRYSLSDMSNVNKMMNNMKTLNQSVNKLMSLHQSTLNNGSNFDLDIPVFEDDDIKDNETIKSLIVKKTKKYKAEKNKLQELYSQISALKQSNHPRRK